MNATIITLPIFMVIIIGFATQLETLATDTSDKALAFADDMNGAMDCATRGIPISQCSPELMNYDFSMEQAEFESILDDMQDTLTNVTVVDEETNETIVIVV